MSNMWVGLAWALGLSVSFWLVWKGAWRLQLSMAKQPGAAGHAKMARLFSRWVPMYQLEGEQFFTADKPADAVKLRRQQGFRRLADQLAQMHPNGQISEQAQAARELVSDVEFVSLYRVPFQYRNQIASSFKLPYGVSKTAGNTLWDAQGNAFMDLTGAYGCNVLGYDAYKGMIRDAVEKADAIGPVLGPYSNAVVDNARRLCEISHMDEVSFHMSGTEAVMQAVRLAQYHTGKRKIVRFAGAYHGWWGEVQPGVGNPVGARHTLTLKEMGEQSLRVLAHRRDVACVLVNPLQALHPNSNAPGDGSLLSAASRKAGYDKVAYTQWLKRLREVCNKKGIVLIFDEVFLGFRLARGGAQAYFGVQADMVTYGKTLGGGLPVGVLCGKRAFMKRYKASQPANICFARGTFNAHPYVMQSMNCFLKEIEQPHHDEMYRHIDEVWNARAERLNAMLSRASLPVQVRNMASVWTIVYTAPSRFHWMFQFYLITQGLMLGWVGSGRLIFSHTFSDADMDVFYGKFMDAARRMKQDGWWDQGAQSTSDQAIRNSLVRELMIAKWGRWLIRWPDAPSRRPWGRSTGL